MKLDLKNKPEITHNQFRKTFLDRILSHPFIKKYKWILSSLFFLIVGLGGSYFYVYQPWQMVLEAKTWIPTECKIIHSQVKEHTSYDGTTNSYSINITFEYIFDGKLYKSNRYNLTTETSKNYSDEKAIADKYPVGAQTTCYVNPLNPQEAVLKKTIDWETKTYGFIFIFSLIIGIAGIIFFWFVYHPNYGDDNMPGGLAPNETDTTQSIVLKEIVSTPWKFIGVFFAGILWNGAVLFFSHDALTYIVAIFKEGHPDFMLPILYIFSVLIGIILIFAIIITFMQLFNPTIELEISPVVLYPGTEAIIKWRCKGKTEKIVRLNLFLIGKELAEYQRGSNTSTASNSFLQMSITSKPNSENLEYGEARFTIPKELPPTFQAKHNEIKWAIALRGEIKFWPDIKSYFPIKIYPLPQDKLPEIAINKTPTEERSEHATIKIDSNIYLPGDKITGAVLWQFDPNKVPKEMSVALFWQTEGRGDADGEVIMEMPIQPRPSGEEEFSFGLPLEPYSFEGKLISLKWRIEFSGKKPTFSVKKTFIVSPTGNVLLLGKSDALLDRAINEFYRD